MLRSLRFQFSDISFHSNFNDLKITNFQFAKLIIKLMTFLICNFIIPALKLFFSRNYVCEFAELMIGKTCDRINSQTIANLSSENSQIYLSVQTDPVIRVIKSNSVMNYITN